MSKSRFKLLVIVGFFLSMIITPIPFLFIPSQSQLLQQWEKAGGPCCPPDIGMNCFCESQDTVFHKELYKNIKTFGYPLPFFHIEVDYNEPSIKYYYHLLVIDFFINLLLFIILGNVTLWIIFLTKKFLNRESTFHARSRKKNKAT